MRRDTLIALMLAIIIVFPSCRQNTPGERISLNTSWRFFCLDEANSSEEAFHQVDFNDVSWESVSLPHTAHIEPLLVNDQWQGICWYRRALDLPKTFSEKKISIELEAAMNHSVVWFNGHKITVHQGGYLPVVVDISKYVKAGEKNVLAVRLNNTDNAITGPKPLKKLDFNMYGGLYRNAWLIVKNGVHISHSVLADKVAGGGIFITFPKVSEKESLVRVKTHIVNEETVSKDVNLVNTIFYRDQEIHRSTSDRSMIDPGGNVELTQMIPIPEAKLWSPLIPHLYQLKTEVYVDGALVDMQENRFGIREFVFEDNDLYINGEKTFLRGVNRHQEYPYVGYALSDNAQYRDAKKIKEAGFNFIRLSHYPQSPAFMDACDELGLLVLDAILGWQYYLDNDQFRDYCYRSSAELIRRDRNHPCVLAWETSLNETQMPVFFMEELHRIVHAEYPGENTFSCGWMDDVYDIYLQARQHRIRHYNEVQEKPYVVSEYGDWEYHSNNPGLNQHRMPKDLRVVKSSRQLRSFGEERLLQQASNIQEAHNDNFNTPAFADAYWVMFDYNRGYYDNMEASGIMDIFRLPKFSYYFFSSQKDPEEEVELHIASYWTSESPLNLKVFSNCDEVELYINKSLIAKQQADSNHVSNNLVHPPFTFSMESFKEGTLKAIGYIDGEKVAEDIVRTPGIATALKIRIDESGRAPQSECNDVLFLYITAIDENGTIVPDFSEKVKLDMKGDADIINNKEIIAEAGIGAALVKIGNSAGEINVSAVSGNLLSGEFSFNVQK